MARKKLCILQQLQQSSHRDRNQHEARIKLAAREHLNERFDRVVKGPQLTQFYADSTEYHNVTSRPMGHPALWATFSTIGNFKHYLRVATIIQSEFEPLELLFSIFFPSLSKTA